jgi:hypothetical protein
MAITTPTTASSSSHTRKLRRPTRVLKVVKVQGSGLLPPGAGKRAGKGGMGAGDKGVGQYMFEMVYCMSIYWSELSKSDGRIDSWKHTVIATVLETLGIVWTPPMPCDMLLT